MFRFLVKVPNKVGVAFSGGVDSLAIAHFLKKGNKEVTLYHFNHLCQYSADIEYKCCRLADRLRMPIVLASYHGQREKGQSLEDAWRRARYRFLRSCDQQIITGHHIDDAVETWVWSSLHGEGKLIPVTSGNIIRPFLTTEKSVFENHCKINKLDVVEDEMNKDLHLMRNYMRANMMQHIYHINPGLRKVIKKKYINMINIPELEDDS
jgi:tRNA(Ile)-lysidine synthetase-like protein